MVSGAKAASLERIMNVNQDFQKQQDLTEDTETSFLEFWILALVFVLLVGFLANAGVQVTEPAVTQDSATNVSQHTLDLDSNTVAEELGY
jgi:hypothetical protein